MPPPFAPQVTCWVTSIIPSLRQLVKSFLIIQLKIL
nr:MAG TPA: hypothetical protein [Caudoviricetes sp.]